MKEQTNSRPGVMIYFEDFKPIIDYLNNEQLGLLLKAILAYAENGEWLGEDCDGNVRFVLNTLRSKIDRDAERYERSVLQKRHAAYSREQKRNGKEPMDFDAWIEVNNTLHH